MREVPYQELYPMGGSDPNRLLRKKQTRKAKPFPGELFNKLPRCPYRQDLEIICFEDCGKGNACDCEIWMRHSGLLAQGMQEARSA